MEKIEKIRKWFQSLKSTMRCTRCPENIACCLDFHHVEKKKKKSTISRLVAVGANKSKILKEIQKCIILCSNCHRKEHLGSLRSPSLKGKSKLTKYILKQKIGKICPCGETAVYCLDFHHLEPKTKRFALGNVFKLKGITLENIKEEIKKCELICSNCHRKRHSRTLRSG